MLDQKENTSCQYSLSRFLSKQERPSSAAASTGIMSLPQSAIVTKKYATTSSDSRPASSVSSSAADYDDDDQSNEITAEYLKSLTGFDELHLVSEAELQVDNKTQSVHLLSSFIPNVVHLRLSRSNVNSLREFGTNFTSLRVLWLSASNLNSLSGIHHLGEHLRELFLAFNHIKDVSPLCFGGLKHLEVLDLEGNMITDGKPAIQELISIKNLPSLKSLNLAGNPFVGTESPGVLDGDGNESNDDEEEKNFSQFQFYHRLVLDRLKDLEEEMNQEDDQHEEDLESKSSVTKKKRVVPPLELLDDIPIQEIKERYAKSSSSKRQRDEDDDEHTFDGRDGAKSKKSDEEFFSSARRRLHQQQQRLENENKRNDPLFRTMFDELSLLCNAIRTQTGKKTGESLVAEETVRTTSRLMSRQRSLASEEQRQRYRMATADDTQKQRQKSFGKDTNNEDDDEQQQQVQVKRPSPPSTSASLTQPRPPPTSQNNFRPTPPNSSSTSSPENNNSSDSTATVMPQVGNLIHRLRSSKKMTPEKGERRGNNNNNNDENNVPSSSSPPEEALSMAEILSKKIANSHTEKMKQRNSQDPRIAAYKRHQMDETDKLLEEIDARYFALEKDVDAEGNGDDDHEQDGDTRKPTATTSLRKPIFRSLYDDPTNNSTVGEGDGLFSARTSVNLENVSKSHQQRMHQAKKLIELANKKREEDEKKFLQKKRETAALNKSPKEKEYLNDDDDAETASESSETSYTSSTSSTTTTSFSSDSTVSSTPLSSRSSSASKQNAVVKPAPISDTEILQHVLEDKEIAYIKLKKDIAARDEFRSAMANEGGGGGVDDSRTEKFESLDWQKGSAIDDDQSTL